MKKKILSLALALATCLSLLAVPVYAARSGFTIRNGILAGDNGPYGANVTIPHGVTGINTEAFMNSGLAGVTIPDSVIWIGNSAFAGCPGLTSVTIPGSVNSIGKEAFINCSGLTDVTISYGVTSIGEEAFSRCSRLTSVTIPSSMTEIYDSAFAHCTSLTSVTISNSVTKIGNNAFADCSSLTSVTIPDSMTWIRPGSFKDCTSLTSVTIPDSINSIDEGAFNGCKKLTDVYYSGTVAQWKAIRVGKNNVPLTSAKIHYNSSGSNQPEQPSGTQASPTNDKLKVNGNAATPTVYKINGSNYFKIRDVAALLNGTKKQFAVGYDGRRNAVTATTGQGYRKQSGDLAGAATGGNRTAALSNDAIYINDEKIEAEVYKIDGSNYFKLRDLGKALDFYVGWSAERGMYIETNKPYSE